MSEQTNTPKHTNRLAREKSPYLLQHQHNPVDWHPWGEEAFQTAKREDKPILLSIGYSTCHWCHVMERESFEDEETAAFMNAHFVCIKLDREERPDIDKIYMTFVQAMTGSGGWPLNVFLTPDLKPFYGGTYFPPDGRYGRPSWMQILKQIANVWDTRKEEVLSSSDNLYERMKQAVQQEANDDAQLSDKVLDNAAEQFKKEYDPKHGGFGRAPKFPRPAQPIFLLRHAARTKDQEAVDMVLFTCEKMAAGGMYDQLGGGFARYSVDDKWLVPHFEKMLYDNAQLIQLYLDAYLVGDRPQFAEVVRDVIRYVLRDMTHPEGGFYSAEDADSEGKEGKFYTWTLEELKELLTSDEFDVAKHYYGITAEGNFEDHSDPEPLKNQNVLSVVNPGLDSEQKKHLESAREKMFQAREKRVRPGLDDKVLASWNGMMLGAIARAYAVLGEEQYLEAARKNLRFLKDKLWDADSGTLYHRWREGERDTAQLLDDYANLLSGVLELYQAALETEHLEFAIQLADSMIERFYDRDHGGFWQSGEESKHLIIRVKEDYDGAEPSGNSVAVLALLKLAAITDQAKYKQAAERSAKLFADRARDLPQAVPYLLSGIDFLIHEPHRAVLVAEQADKLKPLILASHQVYQPNKVVLSNQGPVENMAKEMPVEKEPLAYVCTGTACLPPTGDANQLKKLLQ